jgi:MFS family permease
MSLFASASVFGSVRILFPVHYEDSRSLLGIALGMFPLTALLFSIPFGMISDRFSPKKLLITTNVAMVIFPFGLSLQLGFAADLLFLGIGGIANCIIVTVGPSLYQKLMGEGRKTFKLGLLTFFQALAWGTGLIIVKLVSGETEPEKVFEVLSIGAAIFLIVTLFIPDSKPFRFPMAEYIHDLSNRTVVIFLLLVLAMSFHFGLEGVCLPLFIKVELGVDSNTTLFSLLFGGFAAYMAVMSLSLSLVFQNTRWRGQMMYFGLIAASVSNIAVFWIDSLTVFLIWRLLHLLGDAAYFLAMRLLLDHIFDKRKLGGPFGVVTMVTYIGTFVGMQVSNALDLRTPFVLAGVLPLIVLFGSLPFKPSLGTYEYHRGT